MEARPSTDNAWAMSLLKSRILWLIGIVAALAYASQHYTVGGWQHLRIEPRSASSSTGGQFDESSSSAASWTATKWVSSKSIVDPIPPQRSQKPTLRLASFNLQGFGESKASKLAVMEILARLLRSFDVIAIQDIQPHQGGVLPKLIDRINLSDRRYDYCIGPRIGTGLNAMHLAFVFDTDQVDFDRYQLYTVEDPSNQLEFEPLVGWFRAKKVKEEDAFTFTLVNLRISPPHADRELPLLPELIRSILRDGRDEDDILLAGDFGCSDTKLEPLRRIGMAFALEGVTTSITSQEMLDNIVFPAKATDEYLGRSGAVDFLRQFNLLPDQAMQVSNHMPVWAEFSAEEGGLPGYRAD